MLNKPLVMLIACLFALSVCRVSHADNTYYTIPLDKLTLTEGKLPTGTDIRWRHWGKYGAMRAYAVVQGGEAIISTANNDQPWRGSPLNSANLHVRAGADPELIGVLFVPQDDVSGMVRLPFKVEPGTFKSDRTQFLRAKLEYYRGLQSRELPGAAWYRHEIRSIIAELGDKAPPEDETNQFSRRPDVDQMENTFAMFSGGRAISENLQLDRGLPATSQPADEWVKLDTLTGITVQEMDWKALTKDLKLDVDPLAAIIPADQHAVFFPSFEAFTTLIDRSQQLGSLMLAAAESRSEDAMTQQRYERQLCLSLSTLGRLLGPQLVDSVAVTGSDPYLRIGSDVAVIFESKNAAALSKLIAAQVALAQQAAPGAKPVSGQIDGIAYSGAQAPDRSISSYSATIGNAVVVTNSVAQLKQIVATHKGTTPSLSSLPEYTFFRDRYKRNDPSETALIMLSDATIRRWCGPQWRIADSRRTRAAAVMSNLHAENARNIVGGAINNAAIRLERPALQLGEVTLTSSGVRSSVYGSLEYMIPIRELEFDQVTRRESVAYGRWRNTYQQYWRQFFDPIACRISLKETAIGVDLTVMPLIGSSDYRQFVEITTGAALRNDSGDPHDAVAHLALAINPDSPTIRSWGKFIENITNNLQFHPLSWVGGCVALYADDDPFWNELAASEDSEKFIEKNYQKLPVALFVESRDAMRLAAFLTMARGFIEQSAPNLTTWESLNDGQRQYVKISATLDGPENRFSLYYASLPKALIITLNEDMLKRAMTRQAATTRPADAPATQPANPWLGQNIALHLSERFIKAFWSAANQSLTDAAQVQAWSNIPILNEWKQLFPDKNPIDVHQKLFQTRLIDPAGGDYVWNAQWHTFESTTYGHPGEPKAGPSLTASLQRYTGDFGLTFENNGLRARAQLEQK
jgi:hypothetical protein